MKIVATFDGTPTSEATLPLLERMAALPDAEFTLIAVAHEPGAQLFRGVRRQYIPTTATGGPASVVEVPQTGYAETKDQAIRRRRAELEDYLLGLASRLPQGTEVHVEAHIAGNAGEIIVERAGEVGADVIVMATHSRSRIAQALFGSTTEQVIRSGVAPVLVVHPKSA